MPTATTPPIGGERDGAGQSVGAATHYPRRDNCSVDLAAKLQLKSEHRLECVRPPDSVSSALKDFTTGRDGAADAALLVFVNDRSVLEEHRTRIVEAVNDGHLTWVSYPKSGQLGTDLNRDSLAALLTESGVQPVRQIAIDDVWSALRFRPL
jgi:hypothetical protein